MREGRAPIVISGVPAEDSSAVECVPGLVSYVQFTLWGRIYHDAAEAGAVDSIDDPERIERTW